MRKFLSAVIFCSALLAFGLFIMMPSSKAEENLIMNLLNLPAPPPPNPLVVLPKARDEKFYSTKNPPPDDAPIEDILDYWKKRNEEYDSQGYNIYPSKKTLERIHREIEKNPESLPDYLNMLKEGKDSAELVKRLFRAESSEREISRQWRERVRKWLTYNSDEFAGHLIKASQEVKDEEEYLTNQEELLALAKVDFEKAKPIIDRLYNDSTNPISQTLAKWALYSNAIRTNSSDIDRYRDELKSVVEDKGASPGKRDLAFDGLSSGGDWAGRDDWYFKLLEDETLADLQIGGSSYTGLTTMIRFNPSDKYIEKMIKLSESNNKNVRQAAVRNLQVILEDDPDNLEIIKALLPWLEDPNWTNEVDDSTRLAVVRYLANNKLPESVPGLIATLTEKAVINNLNTNKAAAGLGFPYSNKAANVAVNVVKDDVKKDGFDGVDSGEYYPLRLQAIAALIRQEDFRAAGPLRLLLPEVKGYELSQLVRAIFESKGFSISEQVAALEEAAKVRIKSEALRRIAEAANSPTVERTVPSPVNIANVFTNIRANGHSMVPAKAAYTPEMIPLILSAIIGEPREADDELLSAALTRIGQLEEKSPEVALAMRNIVGGWRGNAINKMMLRDLKNGRSNAEAIIRLLTSRKELMESIRNNIYDIRAGHNTALGISSCLIEDNNEYDAILSSENIEAKTAMLACARLIRAPLPIKKVAMNLASENKLLALAAERYLESEDSAEARNIVLSKHPDEALVMGAREAFFPRDAAGDDLLWNITSLFNSVNEGQINYEIDSYRNQGGYPRLDKAEEKLRKEVRENQGLLGIYAYDNNYLRIYKEKAVFSWEDDISRYRERIITAEEFDAIKLHFSSNNVDELRPFIYPCGDVGCYEKELLMLGKKGGRRVYFRAGEEADPPFFRELDRIFERMKEKPGKLRYYLDKQIPGLEILFEDENLRAATIWKSGNGIELLVADRERRRKIDDELEMQEEAEEASTNEGEYEDSEYEPYSEGNEEALKRRSKRSFEEFSWHRLSAGKLGETIKQPEAAKFIPADPENFRPGEYEWKSRATGIEIKYDEEAIYKLIAGRKLRIRKGGYDRPLISSDGKWLIANKYGNEENYYRASTFRINLQTNSEFEVKTDSIGPSFSPITFIPALNKFLFMRGYYEPSRYYAVNIAESWRFILVDPATGAIQEVKGEFRPLLWQTFRPLQHTKIPNEYWAALPGRDFTEIGKYDTKALSFKPLIKLPEIRFTSMEMFADEGEGKIYFVYEGHLLRIPMPRTP